MELVLELKKGFAKTFGFVLGGGELEFVVVLEYADLLEQAFDFFSFDVSFPSILRC